MEKLKKLHSWVDQWTSLQPLIKEAIHEHARRDPSFPSLSAQTELGHFERELQKLAQLIKRLGEEGEQP